MPAYRGTTHFRLNFGEFATKFENIGEHESVASMGLFDEKKNRGRKSRDTVPLTLLFPASPIKSFPDIALSKIFYEIAPLKICTHDSEPDGE
jgi:hypothetical protein